MKKNIIPLIVVIVMMGLVLLALYAIANSFSAPEKERQEIVSSGQYTNYFKAPIADAEVKKKINPEIYAYIAAASRKGKRFTELSIHDLNEQDYKILKDGGYKVNKIEHVSRGFPYWTILIEW
jgi:hypothetical protein